MIQHAASYGLYRKLGTLKDLDCEVLPMSDKMQVISDKIMTELKLAHNRSAKLYNTKAREVQFKIGQVVYRRNFKQSSQVDSYNAKLAPKQVKCVVLKAIGNSMYELGDMNGKRIGVYHAKDMFVG
ncbi:PREDICTED: uncharacterized protein LOC108360456 [Rhagoletis zephyria]|uniref:uncharacterized protein LOC108360456 n=1 Tax=Rhagoletis zephyria TaxID=28612 RepID=UPI0008114DAE|nr:PREDICTED: uncharacterized protein LOC108360456 [Rhagoletis zephyria]